MLRQTEAQLQKTVLAYLTAAGVFHFRANSGAVMRGKRLIRMAVAGTPDVLACVCGRFVGIELKSESGVQRESQKAWQAALEEAGGVYWVIRDLDSLRDKLRSIVFDAP